MNSCETELVDWLKTAFETAFPGKADFSKIRVLPAQDAKFGDFQCNDAMGFAKLLHLPPRKIAEAAAKAPLPPFLSKAEVAGPGFINLTVSPDWLAAQLGALAAAPVLGVPQAGAGKTVIIDYSSPNAAKQMHIGHIRSTVIGNAIDRLFRAIGYRVVADNHLGDWGTQFGILIKGYRDCLTDAERAGLAVAHLEKAYVESSSRGKTDAAWKDACRAELVKLQQGDPADLALWKKFIDISIGEFTRMYDRLGVHFDTWRGESYYNGLMAGVVTELKAAGLAELSEGAQIVKFEKEGLPIAIVQKSDGGYNYTTSDIACVESRVKDYDPERIVYVTDDRQKLHFQQFFIICAKLGVKATLVHVPFGLMSYNGKAISTREGNLIKLDDLLAEAKKRALAVIQAGKPTTTASEQEKLAEAIGYGAIKYADLSHDPATAIDFNWDKALALEGNSGPYLQYAYARVQSLLDRAAAEAAQPAAQPAPLVLSTPVEKALALQLLQYPATVLRAANAYKPAVLADYLFALSQTYSSFYQRSPVLKSDPATRASRLRLCELFGRVLAAGLGLLGIQTPNRI